MKRILLFHILFLLLISVNTYSVPAIPTPFTITQPDGTTLTVRLKGDEFYHYHTTVDGYLIKKNHNGVFNYANLDVKGKPFITNVKARNKELRTASENEFLLTQRQNPDLSEWNIKARMNRAIPGVLSKSPSISTKTNNTNQFPRVGSPRTIVILVNFADISFVTPNPKIAFTKMLNEEGYSANGATGSARDYFIANSMGTFSPQFDVIGPYRLPHPAKYYGENDASGNDKNPTQMIVDACKVAHDSGIDFADYDTDGDGIIDNVFVYYAGHNEAEGAPADRVWPHRWGVYPTEIFGNGNYSGTVSSVTFNGKRIEDYACTSELRGRTGKSMAGIGTFTHEFGHVLGLADMYPTNNKTHMTLSDWNIMDSGAYLNDGRTPPSYNSFERFQLGFLRPMLLKNPYDATLYPLNTHNTAYLISSTESHNLNGSNPLPTEFFLLENRQKTGWDSYLPGNGLLIYRINYNQYDWDLNQPNNEPDKMGVDIIEADGKASENTLSGDPFPGTSNVTSYTPKLRNGTLLLEKRISFIKESDKIITFRFNGGANSPQVSASNSFSAFNTVQGTPSEVQSVIISGKKLINNLTLSFSDPQHFEMKLETDPETAWKKSISIPEIDSIVANTVIQIRYNPTVPSYLLTHGSVFKIESDNAEPMGLILTGKSSRPVYIVVPTANEAKNVTYHSFIANWEPVNDASGYYLTVFETDMNGIKYPLFLEKWVTTTSDTIYNLISDRNYTYHVKASDKNVSYGYENIRGPSNTINVRTEKFLSEKGLRVVPKGDGKITVFVPEKNIGTEEINVFNSIGQKISSLSATAERIDFMDLPKNVVLIIQTGKHRTKVIITD